MANDKKPFFYQHEKFFQFKFIHEFVGESGSKFTAGLQIENNIFVILSSSTSEALHIHHYSAESECFEVFQNLDFDSKITSMEIFYLGGKCV